MTHKELLEKLAYTPHTDPNGDKMHKALQAIMELHAPHTEHKNLCGGCFEEESGFSDYPCPTIQTIGEALK